MSESERFPGRRPGKSPAEKSNFAQVCTLLSQFVKEKRNLGVGVSGITETREKAETFLPSVTPTSFMTSMKNQAGVHTKNAVVAPSTAKPSDFVQKLVGFGAEDSNKADPRKSTVIAKPESSQMTIFYSGQVLVFNDLAADKANELIALAKRGSSNVNGSVSVSEPVVIEIIDLSRSDSPEPAPILPINNNNRNNKSEIDINVNVNENKNTDDDSSNKQKKNDRTLPQRPSEPANGSDLPIARRNSLHRFLEKRRDRVASKAPYQVPNHLDGGAPVTVTVTPPKAAGEGCSNDGECSEEQLELKL